MPLDLAFSLAGALALAGWLALAVAPLAPGLADLAAGRLVPLVLSLGYAAAMLAFWRGAEGGFGSLAEVQALFGHPGIALAGWVHYLAFDLVVGAWEVREARRAGVPHPALLPALALTFLFGPGRVPGLPRHPRPVPAAPDRRCGGPRVSAAAILETGGRPAPGAPALSPAFLAAELWRRQPVLTAAGVAVLALLAPCLAAHLVEGTGAPSTGSPSGSSR
jgi:hypothetical protein